MTEASVFLFANTCSNLWFTHSIDLSTSSISCAGFWTKHSLKPVVTRQMGSCRRHFGFSFARRWSMLPSLGSLSVSLRNVSHCWILYSFHFPDAHSIVSCNKHLNSQRILNNLNRNDNWPLCLLKIKGVMLTDPNIHRYWRRTTKIIATLEISKPPKHNFWVCKV